MHPTAENWDKKKKSNKLAYVLKDFDAFFKLFDPSTHELSESERSWCVPIEDILAKNYDLKAVNPHRKGDEDLRTPEELLAIIESQAEETERVKKKRYMILTFALFILSV